MSTIELGLPSRLIDKLRKRPQAPSVSEQEKTLDDLTKEFMLKAFKDVESQGFSTRHGMGNEVGAKHEALTGKVALIANGKRFTVFIVGRKNTPSVSPHEVDQVNMHIGAEEIVDKSLPAWTMRMIGIEKRTVLPTAQSSIQTPSESISTSYSVLVKKPDEPNPIPYVHDKPMSKADSIRLVTDLLGAQVDIDATQKLYDEAASSETWRYTPSWKPKDQFWNVERPGEFGRFFETPVTIPISTGDNAEAS